MTKGGNCFTLIWLSGANFDLYVLHEWPRLVEQLAQRVRRQATVA